MPSTIDITKHTVSKSLLDIFVAEEDNLKELIMEGYDSLSDRVIDTESASNPVLFREDMIKALDTFEFTALRENDQIELKLPDLDNFNFSNIGVVQQILEGTAGSYVEITYEDLVKITGKTTINKVPIDSNVPLNKRVYLYRYSDFIRRKERGILNKQLVKFPFSNTPSLEEEVFGPAEQYVKENIDDWINGSIDTGIKKVQNSYKGIR